MQFIINNIFNIIFGLISAGLLFLCRSFYNKQKEYQKLLEEKKDDILDVKIEKQIAPIYEELEELREYIRNIDKKEKHVVQVLISSYRFRLMQLCKIFIKQNYITPDQYEQINEFYKIYSDLGGNGQVKEYYEKVLNLPIHEEQ